MASARRSAGAVSMSNGRKATTAVGDCGRSPLPRQSRAEPLRSPFERGVALPTSYRPPASRYLLIASRFPLMHPTIFNMPDGTLRAAEFAVILDERGVRGPFSRAGDTLPDQLL